jgi:hypothetical protein
MSKSGLSSVNKAAAFLQSLKRDRSGNAIMIVAASAFPLIALIGGAVDLSRSYLAESRLQQACDAGVLAARKRLGSTVVGGGVVPGFVADAGNKFFNINFRNNTYGTANRAFVMTLEPDYAISAVATVDVPTTIMRLFGYSEVKLQTKCQAKVNFNNTDIMMVLDTTASMDVKAVPTDPLSKIATMKTVIKNFHKQMEESKGPSIRVRYGFVPYSTNVNVGSLLHDDWVVNTTWNYQTREVDHVGPGPLTTSSSYENWTTPTGTRSARVATSTYAATWHAPVTEADTGYYSCDNPLPASSYDERDDPQGPPVITPWPGPPAGNKTVQHYRKRQDGTLWQSGISGTTCTVYRQDFGNYRMEYDYVTIPYQSPAETWYNYARLPHNVTNWRTETPGCVEERRTYEIDDYNNVDFSRALDLDIRTVPSVGNDTTKWKPMYRDIIFARNLDYYGVGSFSFDPVITTEYWMFQPNRVPNMVTCPTVSRKLAELPLDTGSPLSSNADLNTYIDGIVASGTTYHDIGMIWGARLLTAFGLFAAENADVGGKPTNRHLIFLTDGQTEAFDIAYGAYGVEPLDRRRWNKEAPVGGLTLNQMVEKRFTVACNQAKADNITVWVIGFDTALSPVMRNCAGNGHWFQANNASQLNVAFTQIAGSLGDLRITK